MGRRFTLASLIWIILVLLPGANVQAAEPVSRNVILSTTTSTQDSGLLDVLIPMFDWLATGTPLSPRA